MLFALLETATAVQSKCLIGEQGNARMPPERRFKPGMDGRPTAASLVSSPPHYLRTTVFLSRQPGPPHTSAKRFRGLLSPSRRCIVNAEAWIIASAYMCYRKRFVRSFAFPQLAGK